MEYLPTKLGDYVRANVDSIHGASGNIIVWH